MGHDDPIALLRIELRERLQQCLDRWLTPATTAELAAGKAERTFLCGSFRDVEFLDTTIAQPVALWLVSDGLEVDAAVFVKILSEEIDRQPDLLSCYGIATVWSICAPFKWVCIWFESTCDNIGTYYYIDSLLSLCDNLIARGNGHVWRTPPGIWCYRKLFEYFNDRNWVPVALYEPLKSAVANNLPQITPTYISTTKIRDRSDLETVAKPVKTSNIVMSWNAILEQYGKLLNERKLLGPTNP